jgi:hypothetical protein
MSESNVAIMEVAMGRFAWLRYAILVPALLLLSMCGSAEDATPSRHSPSPLPAGDSPLPIGDSPLAGPVSPLDVPPKDLQENTVEHLSQLARANLAAELDVNADDIELIDVEAVQWSDTSLGCPQPGMMYAQVITPGYRMTLEVDGQEYVFHTDGGQRVVHCDEE